ncbi:MAG: hypothetical protein OSB21_12005, partial [Myxococcota bacterium]|nr:hypothetical protein [Myxococcota bacterium]
MPSRYWPQIILFSAFIFAGGCARQESSCQNSEQCGPRMSCVEARCVVPCADDAVCGEGVICVAGNCQVGCREHEQCPLGTVCEAEQCINGCHARNR